MSTLILSLLLTQQLYALNNIYLASYNTKTSVWSNAVDISPRTGQFSPGAGANIAYNGSYFAVAFVNESSYDIYVQYGIGTAGIWTSPHIISYSHAREGSEVSIAYYSYNSLWYVSWYDNDYKVWISTSDGSEDWDKPICVSDINGINAMTSPFLYIWRQELYIFTTSYSTPSGMSPKQAMCKYNGEYDGWSPTYYLGFAGATNRYMMSTVFSDSNLNVGGENILFSTLVTSTTGYIYLTMYDGFGIVDTLYVAGKNSNARASSNVAIESVDDTLFLFFKRYQTSTVYNNLYSLTMDKFGNWQSGIPTNVTNLSGLWTKYTPHSVVVGDTIFVVTVADK